MPKPEKPLLEWKFERWQGETEEGDLIWMQDATLHQYAQAWLEAQHVTEPTERQIQDARHHCRSLSYWKNCKDPNVHVLRFGRRAIEHQRQQLQQRREQP